MMEMKAQQKGGMEPARLRGIFFSLRDRLGAHELPHGSAFH